MPSETEKDGQAVTLELLEQLRKDCAALWHNSHELYSRIDDALRQLANPNLHSINLTTAYQIEMWDRYGKDNLRWVLAAAAQVYIGHAAFDEALKHYPGERLTLRHGMLTLRDSENPRER